MESRFLPSDNGRVPSDLAPLLARIRVLVEEPAPEEPALLLKRMERTLTDGYAHALVLEAETLRIEREMDAAIASTTAGEDAGRVGVLADRLAAVEHDLARLRAVLDALRRRLGGVRRSVATPARF